jgi:hypothetical protein
LRDCSHASTSASSQRVQPGESLTGLGKSPFSAAQRQIVFRLVPKRAASAESAMYFDACFMVVRSLVDWNAPETVCYEAKFLGKEFRIVIFQ